MRKHSADQKPKQTHPNESKEGSKTNKKKKHPKH